MDELKKLLENAGMSEDKVRDADAQQRLIDGNITKIVKTLTGTAAAMDKQDRPGVTNPSKANVSVFINFILEQVIDELHMQGFEINFEERDRSVV